MESIQENLKWMEWAKEYEKEKMIEAMHMETMSY